MPIQKLSDVTVTTKYIVSTIDQDGTIRSLLEYIQDLTSGGGAFTVAIDEKKFAFEEEDKILGVEDAE